MAEKTILEPVKKWVEKEVFGSGHGADWNEVFGEPVLQGSAGHVTVNHLLMTGVVVVLLVVVGLVARRKYGGSRQEAVIPEPGLSTRNIVEAIFDYTLNTMSQIMSRETAKRYFSLIATLAIFILFSNLLGLVPGFSPPTQNLNTTAAMSVSVFVVYHLIGLAHHGFTYLKEFISPAAIKDLVGEDASGMVFLAGALGWTVLSALFLVIEMVSHSFRPVSLAVRLTGNMGGDHKVLSQMADLVPAVVPIPFFFIGLIVCLVQALVFALLSIAYIALAVEENH